MPYSDPSLNSADVTLAGDAEGRPSARSGVFDGAEERPTEVGRYQIVDRLGAGGCGVVYEAIDPQLERRVAIKMIRFEEQTDRRVLRLEREAQALACLNDPHIVTVLDVGRHRGQLFIAMELVEGDTLADWGRRGRRDWRAIVGAFVQAASGLQTAHDAGLVHRDFKPSNAMVDRAGRVLVMDFGLAQSAELPSTIDGPTDPGASASFSERLTRTGVLGGTVMYMAPEQFRQEKLAPATDQFGWAVALYELLYGASPFEAVGAAERYVAVNEGRWRTPPAGSRVPQRVWSVIRRCLDPDPAERWPSMREAADALQSAVRPKRWLGAGIGAALLVATVAIPVLAGDAAPAAAPQEAERTPPEGAQRLADLLQRRASVWKSADRAERARVAQEIFAVATEVGDDEPAVDAALDLAAIARHKRDFDVAERWLRQAESRRAADDLRRRTRVAIERGLLAEEQDDLDRATEVLVALLDELVGSGADVRELEMQARNNLAYIYLSQGEHALARAEFERELAISEDFHGEDHPTTAGTRMNLATTLLHQNDFEAGTAILSQACDSLLAQPEPVEPAVYCLVNLAAKNLDDATIAKFQRELGAMGYKFQFVTLAGFHALNHGMFDLARGYKARGMAAYSELQDQEFADEANGYTATRHQREVGTGYFDEVRNVITGGQASTGALAESTEAHQF